MNAPFIFYKVLNIHSQEKTINSLVQNILKIQERKN